MENIRIAALSGSLRAGSSNTALLQAAQSLALDGMEIYLYEGMNDLPHFNPDLEGNEPAIVQEFRATMQRADGLLISTPEYAHGVPGVLKNALDWLVGSGETVGKPFALFNASPRAHHAQDSLTEILTTMAGIFVPEASIAVPLLGRKLDAVAIASDEELALTITEALAAFAKAVSSSKSAASR